MTDENPRIDPNDATSMDRVSVRRAPRYPRFIVLGAGLGAIVTFIVTALHPADPQVGFTATLGFFLLFGIPAGAALGGVTAIVLDAVATRRAKELDAERTTVDPAPESGPESDQER
ncbi:MAG: hypothetical protein JWL94_148 [Microbacteriaceae bacterium]|jgi:pimeloyl-ACP methyl ester carboxylesterase|nr:hypothetical protein [Microbacteriaceae bacterium]HEV7957067.1 hypothetical protein [Marisediminicola sp.]